MIPTGAAIARIAAMLDDAGIADARREARLILAHALKCDIASLWSRDSVPDDAGVALAARRAAHEPLAYITGHREFWSLDLVVSPATLIPRPDTETLIEAALRHRPDRERVRRILDLGTGTGALLLASLTEFPAAFGIGVDDSPAAAALARDNAARLGLADRAAFFVGNWGDSLATRFDLILANPPYIRSSDMASLMPDVALHEPASALDGGPDGLDAYRRIIAGLPGQMAPGGIAILESGAGQQDEIAALACACGFVVKGHADLASVIRAIVMTKAGHDDKKTIW